MPRLFTNTNRQVYFWGISLCLVIVLNCQHPFGEYTWHLPHHHLILTGLGCLFMLTVMLFYGVLPRMFRNYYALSNWTVGKETVNMVIFFVASCLVNWIYMSMIIAPQYGTLMYAIRILSFTLTFNAAPIVLVIFIQTTTHLVHKFVISETETLDIKSTQSHMFNNKPFLIHDILLFAQDSNYYLMHYLQNEEVVVERIRGSMKQLSDDMKQYTQFRHCHTSYLVNTDRIEYYCKRRGSRRLKIAHYDKEISVAYNFRNDFNQYTRSK